MDSYLVYISFWLAIGLAALYTLGQHWRTRFSQALQAIGLAGTGLIIVWWFFSACPIIAAGLVIKLLVITLIVKLFVWIFFRSFYDKHPHLKKENESGESNDWDEPVMQARYEEALKSARPDNPSRRPAGFEATDQNRRARQNQNS